MLRTDRSIALALFGLFTAFYWFIFGGHFYSPDEEMIYYVTEGIVERGSFAVPEQGGTIYIATGAKGVDGDNYAITGLLQSILAIPLYLVGRVVSTAFAPCFQPFWTRFFVSLLNGLVGGGTAALMYLLGRKLSYRRSTALFLALGLGLTTFVAIYARTFFSESLVTLWLLLAVWAALSYRSSRQRRWAILLGLALGLSVATKVQSVIAVPAFVCYLLIIMMKDLTGWRARLRWFGETTLLCVLGGLLPMLLVLGYNYARFGSPLETGATIKRSLADRAFEGSPLVGLYGLLFSAGRGFFLYAPLAVLGVVGTRALSKRHGSETWLLWLLILTHLLFYAFWGPRWFGGGGWGPRYLTYVVPLTLLPAGAFFESEAYSRKLRLSLASLLFFIGLLVQTGAILTNFNSYYTHDFVEGQFDSDQFLYNPNYSAAWGHWTLWSERYEEWKHIRSDLDEYWGAKFAYHGWLHPIEAEDLAPYGRWMSGWVAVAAYELPEQSLDLAVTYWRPLDEGVPQDALAFSMDGQELESSSTALDSDTSGRYEDTVSLTAERIVAFPPQVVFTSTLWSPAAVGVSEDGRELGVFIESISVQVDGREMQVGGADPLFPRMPLSASPPWSPDAFRWFYKSEVPHLVDTWWWYVSVIGLLPEQVRTVQWVGLAIVGLIGGSSLYLLVTGLRRSSIDEAVAG